MKPEAAAEQLVGAHKKAELEEELTDETILEAIGQVESDPGEAPSVRSKLKSIKNERVHPSYIGILVCVNGLP